MNGTVFGILLLLFIPFAVVMAGTVLGLIRDVKTHRHPPVAALILLGIGVLLLLGSLTLSLLGSVFNLHLFLFGKGLFQWQFLLRTVFIPLLLFGGLFVAVKKVLCWKTLIYCTLLCAWFFLFSAASLFLRADVIYTEISSPASAGTTHELVFEEKSLLLAGEGAVYEKISPCFMKKLGRYPTDDGFAAVASKTVRFTWAETGFTLIDGKNETNFQYITP
ncbi:MAG: hypothetical protein IJA91_07285 [Clostridia bacterium]|nr:hypothetical protein [Clostridia bacterium]